jgi:hypothetical protein
MSFRLFAFASALSLCLLLISCDEKEQPQPAKPVAVEKEKPAPVVEKKAEKESDERGLSMRVTFDKKSVTADYAAGQPASIASDPNLEFRMFLGYNKQNAFNIAEDEELKYDVRKNIDPREGTLSMWLLANNYSPRSVQQSDPDVCHKVYANIRFSDGKNWSQFFLYQYYHTPTAFLYWNSSYCRERMYRLAGAPLTGIGEKQWFQITVTWTLEKIRIFLNGELQSETAMPEEARLAAAIVPDPAKSFIGIRTRSESFRPFDTGKETAVDDISIYTRALTDLEIKRQYLQSAGAESGKQVELPNIDIQLHGVDDTTGKLDRLLAQLDYSPLPAAWQDALKTKKVGARAVLRKPDGKEFSEKWNPVGMREDRIMNGVETSGMYEYQLTLSAPGLKSETAVKKIERPDTGWFNNPLGQEDVVPSPWTPLALDDKDTVTLWNRVYSFAGQPLPVKVEHGGDSLLAQAPELIIETAQGREKISYTVDKRETHNTWIEFSGVGKAQTFSLDWKTRVEFDGMIRFDYSVRGKPEIKDMRLEWTVAKAFTTYTLTPLLSLTGEGEFAMPFPYDDRKAANILWLTSSEKGFCWAPEHDANWIYDQRNDKPITVKVDADGGHCTVRMVNRATAIPDSAAYHAIFIATPARPLPEKKRTYRMGGYGRYSNCDISLNHHAGAGTLGVFTFRPGPTFQKYVDFLKKNNQQKIVMYGGATAINDQVPEGKYFAKYWSIPGGSVVPFRDGFDKTECLQLNTCPRTRYSDYILDGIKALHDHPGNIHTGVYYDLANNYVCENPLHGCRFKDAFGRDISRLIIMGLRRHLMRTLKYCHSVGWVTIYHAHSYYLPMVHDFGDYWYPGEQYCGTIQKFKSPYVYSDEIPDDVYRSELNQRLKGSGILFLGNLKRADKTYGTEEQTLAMCTKLMLNDIPISISFEDGKVINRIWGVQMRYQLDEAQAMLYYDPAAAVASDNPQVAVTYFLCPGNRVLAVIGNLSKTEQTATVDFSKLRAGLGKARDEYAEQDLALDNGKLKVTLPPRLFRLVGF